MIRRPANSYGDCGVPSSLPACPPTMNLTSGSGPKRRYPTVTLTSAVGVKTDLHWRTSVGRDRPTGDLRVEVEDVSPDRNWRSRDLNLDMRRRHLMWMAPSPVSTLASPAEG